MPAVSEQEVEAVALPAAVPASLDAAYAACARLAARHYENFPVASRLLPGAMRPHVAALYAFARVADDFADEGDADADTRHAQLDGWLEALHGCVAEFQTNGRLTPAPRGTDLSPSAGEIFAALGHTIRSCGLPVALLEDLLSAFRQDITTHRYATWGQVLDYCRRSANPVGRCVLRIAGHRDPGLDALSDSFCTALQLTNFWQDLAVDWRRGRLYLPAEIADACGAAPCELDQTTLTPAWHRALAVAAGRTRALFLQSRPLCGLVGGRLGFELRLTWLGGLTVLERLEPAEADVFRRRPTLTTRDLPRLLWRATLWRRDAKRRRARPGDLPASR